MSSDTVTTGAVGQSAANIASRKAATKVVNAYRQSVGLPAVLTFEEIAGAKLKSSTASICFWLAERAIPANC
jgi:hypothetical protein